jgi:hypothetical protein
MDIGLRLEFKAKRHNRFFPYDKFTVLKWPLKRNKKNGQPSMLVLETSIDGCPLVV